jgi:predicted metal-binding membrane protein
MLLAMMAPLLVHPIDHIWTRSFRRMQWRRVALFTLGYALVWTTAGWLLASVSGYLTAVVRVSYSAVAAVALAIAWQKTPAKQICLNRCHALPTLPAFGYAGDREAIKFGLRSGWWCFGSCWALMLVPMSAGEAHVVAMAATTVFAVSERYATCRPPEGRLPFSRSRDTRSQLR